MKRWLPLCIVALALVVLVSPGIIGHLAERAIEDQIGYAEERDPSFAIATASFERGWFTSAGQYRVPLADPDLAAIVLTLGQVDAQADLTPVLVIDTRIDHGLVPVGAASRDLSEMLPAIASGVSTLSVELGPGQVAALPGTLNSRIGITGSAQFDYQLPAGSTAVDGKSASWEDARIHVTSSPDGRKLTTKLQVEELSIDSDEGQITLASADMEADGEMTGWGFAVGNLTLAVGETSMSTITGGPQGWSTMNMNMQSALQGERMHGSLDVEVNSLVTPNGVSDVRVRGTVAELDAKILGPLIRLLNQVSANPHDASGQAIADLEIDARRLLSAGADINFQEISMKSDAGEFLAAAEFKLPQSDEMLAWTSLLLALQGKADFRVPQALFDANPDFAAQAQPLIAAGFLVRDGDLYTMNVAYAKGLATINGIPMPIPMPGVQ